jgi:hypothetical protein
MTAHAWPWSDIVDPQLVERAIAADKRRAERRARQAKPDPASEREDESRPVAA